MKFGLGIALVLALAVVIGCGSSGSSTTADRSKPRPYPWLKGPSREFLVPGGDNVVQTFGEEATNSQRKQLSRMIALWMKARAAQNWKKDCGFFSRAYRHNLVATDATRVTKGKVKTCPQALDFFGHQASGSYLNNLAGPVDSLRVGQGDGVGGAAYVGFAQYHGNDGRDWIIPLEREGGEWKISNATPIDRLH